MVDGKNHFPLKSLSKFGPLHPAGDVEEASSCCKEGLDSRFLWPRISDQQRLAEKQLCQAFCFKIMLRAIPPFCRAPFMNMTIC